MEELIRLLPLALAPWWVLWLLWVLVTFVAVAMFLEWLPLKLIRVVANWRRLRSMSEESCLETPDRPTRA